ncbi:hypothetical protein C8R43DRAFT_1171594 [Mycena crocata]|nr:hypothetical protein C8R43DRAFT_1171594 [Mycena crocata]
MALQLHNSIWGSPTSEHGRDSFSGLREGYNHDRDVNIQDDLVDSHTRVVSIASSQQPLLTAAASTSGSPGSTAYLDLLARQPVHPNAALVTSTPIHTAPPLSLAGDPLSLLERKATADARVRRRLRRLRLAIAAVEVVVGGWGVYTAVRYWLAYARLRSSSTAASTNLSLALLASLSLLALLLSTLVPFLPSSLLPRRLRKRFLRRVLRSTAALLWLVPAIVNFAFVFVWRSRGSSGENLDTRCTNIDVDVIWSVPTKPPDACGSSTPWGAWLALAIVRLLLTVAVLILYHLALAAYARARRPHRPHSHSRSSSSSSTSSSSSSHSHSSSNSHPNRPRTTTPNSRRNARRGSGSNSYFTPAPTRSRNGSQARMSGTSMLLGSPPQSLALGRSDSVQYSSDTHYSGYPHPNANANANSNAHYGYGDGHAHQHQHQTSMSTLASATRPVSLLRTGSGELGLLRTGSGVTVGGSGVTVGGIGVTLGTVGGSSGGGGGAGGNRSLRSSRASRSESQQQHGSPPREFPAFAFHSTFTFTFTFHFHFYFPSFRRRRACTNEARTGGAGSADSHHSHSHHSHSHHSHAHGNTHTGADAHGNANTGGDGDGTHSARSSASYEDENDEFDPYAGIGLYGGGHLTGAAGYAGAHAYAHLPPNSPGVGYGSGSPGRSGCQQGTSQLMFRVVVPPVTLTIPRKSMRLPRCALLLFSTFLFFSSPHSHPPSHHPSVSRRALVFPCPDPPLFSAVLLPACSTIYVARAPHLRQSRDGPTHGGAHACVLCRVGSVARQSVGYTRAESSRVARRVEPIACSRLGGRFRACRVESDLQRCRAALAGWL